MARDVAVVLQEILDAISLIEEAAAGHDLASFSADRFLQRGTERLLEIKRCGISPMTFSQRGRMSISTASAPSET